MMPTVTQVLATMRQSLEQTVMPALPADAFVQEQVALMMASLDWLVDVHESEYGLELLENGEYRDHLERLGEPVEAAPPAGDLAALRTQTRDMKRSAGDLARAGRGRGELLEVAARQGRREQAWFRMTGFPEEIPGSIAEVLGE